MAYLKRSLGICLWFMFLTLPLMVVRVNTISHEVEWRWLNMVWVGVAAFVISWAAQFWTKRREAQEARNTAENRQKVVKPSLLQRLSDDPQRSKQLVLLVA